MCADHLQNLMRGRKASADQIEIQGIDGRKLREAADKMDGFSGGGVRCFFWGVLKGLIWSNMW
jgi:hypothetical protein